MGPERGKKLLIALEVRKEARAFSGEFQGPWQIDYELDGNEVSETWHENPLAVIPRAIFEVVDFWLALRLRAAKGAHFLPEAGGMLDQPAALMEAFDILDRAMDRTKPETAGDAD